MSCSFYFLFTHLFYLYSFLFILKKESRADTGKKSTEESKESQFASVARQAVGYNASVASHVQGANFPHPSGIPNARAGNAMQSLPVVGNASYASHAQSHAQPHVQSHVQSHALPHVQSHLTRPQVPNAYGLYPQGQSIGAGSSVVPPLIQRGVLGNSGRSLAVSFG